MSAAAWLLLVAERLTFGPVPLHPQYGWPDLTAGMVLRSPDGEYVLVGDVNEQWGVCDDCKYDETFKREGWRDWQAAHLSQLTEAGL